MSEIEEGMVEAEARIQRVLESGETTLNLSELGLEQLPDRVVQLTQLHNLNLSDNQLHQLPKGISNLTQLQLLDLAVFLLNDLL